MKESGSFMGKSKHPTRSERPLQVEGLASVVYGDEAGVKQRCKGDAKVGDNILIRMPSFNGRNLVLFVRGSEVG